MNIELLREIPSGWDQLVLSCPWGSFCHSAANLFLLGKTVPSLETRFLVMRSSDGSLDFGLPFAVKEGPLGKVVNCLPFFGSYGDAVARDGRDAPLNYTRPCSIIAGRSTPFASP
jgi:hypothetical protein